MLRDARKYQGLLTRLVLLFQDNVKPHTVRLTLETTEQLGWKLLEHRPYSHDLTSNNFHLFGRLKTAIANKLFADDEEVKRDVLMWLRQQTKRFYTAGFVILIKRCGKCINIFGDYVKK